MPHTHRKSRTCEVCGETYQPSYYEQRTCSRACGVWIKDTPRVSAVEWATCSVCGRPWTRGGLLGYDTCSQACKAEAHRILFPPRPAPAPRQFPRQVECPMCAEVFTTDYPTAIHCSMTCTRRAARRRRRTREAGTFGEWRWSDFMRIARKFNYCCAYCGEKPDQLEPDHVLPLSLGGPNILANLLPACHLCNSDKSARDLPQWEQWRHERGKPPRRTSWAPEDPRYWHLTYGVSHERAA
jgi:predicted nucleic acid-binding Zn ribbon protein